MVANGGAQQRSISRPDFRKIVEQAKEIVSSDECCPKELTSDLLEAPLIVTEDFVAKAQKLYKVLQKSADYHLAIQALCLPKYSSTTSWQNRSVRTY